MITEPQTIDPGHSLTVTADEDIVDFYNQLPEPPLTCFPPEIQHMLKEAALAFKYIPLEVPIVSFLAFLSACVGRACVVEVKPGWEEAGNLYLVIVADSGVGKSHCLKVILKPVWAADIKHKEKWQAEMAQYNETMEARRRNKEQAELDPPPPQPIRTQYIVEDSTPEAIGFILSENPRGLLWCCDELATVVGNLDRYSGGKGGTKSRLLSTYDGSYWKTSRRDSDKDQTTDAAVLAMTGTVQPEILKELFTRGDALSGFLPRFIFIRAVRRRPAVLTDAIFAGGPLLEKISNHLLSWEMSRDDGRSFPRKVRLNTEAYCLYEQWHNQVMTGTWRCGGMDNSIAPKLVTQVIRIALLLHCLDAALSGSNHLADIGPDTMQKAITLGDWITAHQKQIWLMMSLDKDEQAASLEIAIVQAALALENHLKSHDWKVANEQFNQMVAAKYGQPVNNAQIGKAASRLGLKPVLLGRKRGKALSPHLLKSLKSRFLPSTCRH